jgi:hypothetical protein
MFAVLQEHSLNAVVIAKRQTAMSNWRAKRNREDGTDFIVVVPF